MNRKIFLSAVITGYTFGQTLAAFGAGSGRGSWLITFFASALLTAFLLDDKRKV